MADIQKIVVIDDHPLLRKGLQQLIDICPDLEMVGEASNGLDGLEIIGELKPDLILLDLNMPNMNGLETLIKIKKMDPDIRVIMLTVSDEEQDVVDALRNGADGYLLKDMDPEELLLKFREVAKGKLVLSSCIIDCLGRALRKQANVSELTNREREILIHIHDGESNKVIARKLGITEATVKVHVKHLLKKLNLKTRVEAAVWVANNNIH
ncbi:two-component system response regulator NarL [Candidatus Marithrix sp. Canyon 246]|uniref:two-component system response regulator NarL n=1 Tax=Candidatus Marithrix sp. Canyon 246 TaxID=1827136 RepID=UPI00084A1626|nr:two-component system response regulator NarL [Candidatus Marithrix sp. Canyon 246]